MTPTAPPSARLTRRSDVRIRVAAALATVERPWWTVVEIVLILAYLVARTAGSDVLLLAWAVAAGALALVAPTTGLVTLAAIAPLDEGLLFGRGFGAKPLVLAGIVAGIALRWLTDPRNRVRVELPVVMAGVIVVGTGLGLVISAERFGFEFARTAAIAWAVGVATAFVTLACAAWAARDGEIRPLVAALAGATVTGGVSLIAFLAPEAFASSPFGWMVFIHNPARLAELQRSSVSAAALFLVPVTFYLVTAALARDGRLRVGATLLSLPLLAAAWFTYTRTVYISIYATAAIVAWRISRRLGVAVVVVGIVLLLALAPAYLQMRADTLGGGSQPRPGEQLIASDAERLTAWATSVRMTIAAPLTGHGYRSYRVVAPAYGGGVLNAPHNEWLRLFAEGGVVVGLAGVAFVASAARTINRRRDWLGSALLASFVSIVLAASFNNPFLYNQVMIPAFVVAGTGIALGAASTGKGRATRPAA